MSEMIDKKSYYNQDFSKQMLKRVNNILITEDELNLLAKYSISIDNCSSNQDLILLIKNYLEEDNGYFSEDIEDLEYLYDRLCERDYYENTNK